jgi:hypothetical protein
VRGRRSPEGSPPSAIKAFRFLVAATAKMGLSPSLSKCAAYARLADTGAATAATLDIAHQPEGLFAAGTPPEMVQRCACLQVSIPWRQETFV